MSLVAVDSVNQSVSVELAPLGQKCFYVNSMVGKIKVNKVNLASGTFLSIYPCPIFFPGYVSMELSPVAAVSVRLFSADSELHVSGPIQISLNIPNSCGLHISNVVPAWFFNQTTGE